MGTGGRVINSILPSYQYISTYVSEVTSALIAHYITPFWTPAGTNKDDLE